MRVRAAVLAAALVWAGCGGGNAGTTTHSDGDAPEMIGADDCGGCMLTRGRCTATFAGEPSAGQAAQSKEVPCDPSCCPAAAPSE